MSRWRVGQPLPPHVAVVGRRHIGEDAIGVERTDGVGIGLGIGSRRDAEQARLGIDRIEPPIGAEAHPGDVVADRLGFPAGHRRLDHGEIGLAAGTWERRRDIAHLTLRRGELEDQHMLGEPALVARHDGGDPQRVAFLAEKRVAAIARTVGPDLTRLRIVHDIFGVVARPRHIAFAGRQRCTHRMDTGNEIAVIANGFESRASHPRHDAHRRDHIGAVGDLDAESAEGRAYRSH